MTQDEKPKSDRGRGLAAQQARRQERLAAALRTNLVRRKALSRQQQAVPDNAATEPDDSK